MRPFPRPFAAVALASLITTVQAATDVSLRDFFESKIRPILAETCYECHSVALKKKGGLLLDSRAGWQAGGENGAAIVPGDPAKGLFMQAIRHEHEDLKMPKAGAKLSDAVIADFEKWIKMGAPDPRDKPPTKEEVAKDTDWKGILQRRKSENWAFQPLKRIEPSQNDGGANPVDRFIAQKARDSGLATAKQAEAATIARRLCLVITGLPPTAAMVSTAPSSGPVQAPASP